MLSLPQQTGRVPHHVFLPWCLYDVAATDQRKEKSERKRKKEGETGRETEEERQRKRIVGVDIYPLLFSIARDKGH